MICKHCKAEIDQVNVYSRCLQVGELTGNKIIGWGSVEEILETIGIDCPKCGESLMGEVEE